MHRALIFWGMFGMMAYLYSQIIQASFFGNPRVLEQTNMHGVCWNEARFRACTWLLRLRSRYISNNPMAQKWISTSYTITTVQELTDLITGWAFRGSATSAIRHVRGQRFQTRLPWSKDGVIGNSNLFLALSLMMNKQNYVALLMVTSWDIWSDLAYAGSRAVQFQLDSDASSLSMQRGGGALLRSRILLSLKILLSSNRSNILKFSCEKQKKVSQFHLLLKNKSPTPVSKSPQLL